MTRLPLLALCIGLVAATAACGQAKTRVVVHTRTVTRTTYVTTTLTTTRTVRDPEPTVYVETLEGNAYKPTQISYYGGHQFIAQIKWQSYGGDVAVGHAKYAYDTCDPNCATGKYTYTPITIRLMTREDCHGVVAYRDWSLLGITKDDAVPRSITGLYPACS